MRKAVWLIVAGFAIWTAWRRWTPVGDGDARAPAAFDMRWLCTRGAIEVFTTAPGTWTMGGGRAQGNDAPQNALPAGTVRSVHVAEDIRSITAHCPRGRRRWRTGDRAIAAIHANLWRPRPGGKRSRLWALVIHVDTGAEPGQPGTERTSALIEAGERVAGAVRNAVMHPKAAGAESASAPGHVAARQPAFDAGAPLVIEGALEALPPWPEPLERPFLVMTFPIVIAAAGPAVWGISHAFGWLTFRAEPLPGWIDWWAAIGAPAAVAIAVLWWAWTRHLRRAELARCSWEVDEHGIRVTERRMTLDDGPAGALTRAIAAADVAAVEVRAIRRNLQMRAMDGNGRAVARITLDAIPGGSAEALAAAVRARLGKVVLPH